MPSLKLSNPFRRGTDRPSLKERAATLKATAGRVMSAPTLETAAEADNDCSLGQKALAHLLTGIDFSAMSMRTLCALHDHVEALDNICYGLAAQPRSLKKGNTPNEAGTFLYRLIEGVLQGASDACLQEAKRRGDASDDDRDIRLAMLAREIIENDDRDEIRALARDLLVMTEA